MVLDQILGIGGKTQILNLDSGVFYKECNVCAESKSSKNFRLRKESKNHSRRPFCLSCEKIQRTKNYTNNKQDHNSKVKDYRLKNWELKMLWQAKCTASRKGLDFNLELSDIYVPEKCKYLGILLTKDLGGGVIWSNASLDRINSNKGYVKGNVEVISRKANSMKNMATVDELRIFAKNILDIYGE